MKVWVLRIAASITLIIISLFCQKRIWTPVKNQLLSDSHNKKDIKLQPIEKGLDLKIGKSGSLKNAARDLKREKLAPMFSQRISLLREVQYVLSIRMRMMVVVVRLAAR